MSSLTQIFELSNHTLYVGRVESFSTAVDFSLGNNLLVVSNVYYRGYIYV